jgi:hypothetical protein
MSWDDFRFQSRNDHVVRKSGMVEKAILKMFEIQYLSFLQDSWETTEILKMTAILFAP